jgi:peptide/nickel transport system permease protein
MTEHDPYLAAASVVLVDEFGGATEPDRRVLVESKSYWRISLTRFLADRMGTVALLVLLLLALLAIFAPVIRVLVTHHDPNTQDLTNLFDSPGSEHWLGTDNVGRDTFTRLMYGARITLGVAFLTVLFASTIGVLVGLCAGYFAGPVDEVLMRFVDAVLAIPALLLYMLMAIVFRPTPVVLALIIASVNWCATARLVRAETLSLRTHEYVLAARSIGATSRRTLARHILPHALPTIIVAASISVGYVILIEAALDFLGLGVQPPTASWGNMLTDAQAFLYQSPLLAILPGGMILLSVVSLNLVGNALRDALDPRQHRAG